MSEQPAAGPWTKLEDAPWAKEGHSILGDWGGSPAIAYWDQEDGVWCLHDRHMTNEADPDRVARLYMEVEG